MEGDMPRRISVIALLAVGAAPAAAQGPHVHMRCVEMDKAMVERVRDALDRDDRRIAGTSPLHMVITRVNSARLDCKHGRVERGLQTYAAVEAALRTIEEAAFARTVRSGVTPD
jgi:hypothetical protein